jgi:hypothetical protein
MPEHLKDKETEYDRSTKKVAAFALNFFGIIPVIPMASYGLGKLFQATHREIGLGSNFARTFLQVAKLGLENSHPYPLKDKEDLEKASWLGSLLDDAKESLEKIDYRETELAKYAGGGFFRGLLGFFTGIGGVTLSLGSFIPNFVGDWCLNKAVPAIKDWTKDSGFLGESFGYALVGVASIIGIGFRAPGMLLRWAGSILSADVICCANKGGGQDTLFNTIGNTLVIFDNWIIDQRIRENKPPEITDILNKLPTAAATAAADAEFEAIRKKAFELFQKIKGPSFQSSGISEDKRQYCEVATIKFEKNSYKLLYSPSDGQISIVSPEKDLNTGVQINGWNSQISSPELKTAFAQLIDELKIPTAVFEEAKPYKIGKNSITLAKEHESGVSYEQFLKMKSEGLAKRTAPPPLAGSEFKYKFNEYVYEVDTTGKETLKRKTGETTVPLGKLEEFMIMNDLFKQHNQQINRDAGVKRRNTPHTVVGKPFATNLKSIAKAQNTPFYSR